MKTLIITIILIAASLCFSKADCKYIRLNSDSILISDDRYGLILINEAQFEMVLGFVIQKYVEYNGTTSAEIYPRHVMPHSEMEVWVKKIVIENAIQHRDWWWVGDLAMILYRKTEFNGAVNAELKKLIKLNN